MQETWVQSLGWEDPLEKGKATHSSTPAWRTPWAEVPGGLQSVGSQGVRHDWMPKHITRSVSSVAQSCPTLCHPMDRSTPGLPVHHQLPEFTQTRVHRVGDAIQPSHPLSPPSPPAPNPSQWRGTSAKMAKQVGQLAHRLNVGVHWPFSSHQSPVEHWAKVTILSCTSPAPWSRAGKRGRRTFRRCWQSMEQECWRRQCSTPDTWPEPRPRASPLSGHLLLNLPKGSKETLSAPLLNAEDGKDEGLALVRRQTAPWSSSAVRSRRRSHVAGPRRGSSSGGVHASLGEGPRVGLRTAGAFPNTGLGFLPVKNGEFHC